MSDLGKESAHLTYEFCETCIHDAVPSHHELPTYFLPSLGSAIINATVDLLPLVCCHSRGMAERQNTNTQPPFKIMLRVLVLGRIS